jgi:hypothetical protein
VTNVDFSTINVAIQVLLGVLPGARFASGRRAGSRLMPAERD